MTALEHLRPRAHPFQYLLLHLTMSVAVCSKAQQCIGKCFRSKLSVQFGSAVLAQRIRELESVELDIGVSVGKTLDKG